MNTLNRYLTLIFSLLPTPLLLFVSSAADIYVKNQSLLQYQYQVLTPLAELSLLTLLVGLACTALSRYHAVFRFLLWAYYLLGAVFLLFAFFRGFQATLPGVEVLYTTAAGMAFWPALLIAATLVFGRRAPSPQVLQAVAGFGVILFAYEGGVLFYNIWNYSSPVVPAIETRSQTSPPDLPNIYHFIFDAYQTDLLEHTLNDEATKQLAGFVFFPENKAEWASTPMSLATIFSGRDYLYDRPSGDYTAHAFTSEASFLYWLKSKSYQTVAYIPNAWSGRVDFFDRVVQHDDAAMDELLLMNSEAFWNLWIYGNSPALLRDTVMKSSWFAGLNDDDLENLRNGKLLPASWTVTSSIGFQRMMEEERNLSPRGRYTLAHVIIPHYPLKLRADCSYDVGSSKTEAIEQAHCAQKLILDFTNLLKDLGRFDDSLILIHGDHGGPHRTRNGELVATDRSRSLDSVMLVKPIGAPSQGELEISDLRTSILMIPRVIVSSVADAVLGRPTEAPWNRRRVFVPPLEGELIESAELILERNGFSLGEVRRVEHNLYAEDAVISQEPLAYEMDTTADKVAVVVSSGPPVGPNLMPNFVGRDVVEVTEWLERNQLPISSIHEVPHAIAPKGMVVSQSPRAGFRTDGDVEFAFEVGKGN